MGHISFPHFKRLISTQGARDLDVNADLSDVNCESCGTGKFKRAKFTTTTPQMKPIVATAPGEILHTDLSGIIEPAFEYKGRVYRYFMVIVDDHSRYVWVLLLEKKSDNIKLCYDNQMIYFHII